MQTIETFNSPIYMNKTDVFYRLPSAVDLDEFWDDLIEYRRNNSISLEVKNLYRNNFYICLTDHLKETIVEIDDLSKKNILADLKPEIRDELIKNAMETEAYFTSLIEGIDVSWDKSRRLIEGAEEAKDISEQIVINSYNALMHMSDNLDADIDEKFIFKLYSIITDDILEDDETIETYRPEGSFTKLIGKKEYSAPLHEEIEVMISDLLEFINLNKEIRLHPLLKASIIHFYILYVQPFSFGNGILARAIAYMYLLKNGFDVFRYFSLSSMLKDQKMKYNNSLIEVEEYKEDITYFCVFNAEIMIKNIKQIIEDFNKKYKLKVIEMKTQDLGFELSKRQLKLIERVMKYSVKSIDIEYYKKFNKVTQETARTDMEELVKFEIFYKEKHGKKFVYIMVE